MEVAHYDQRITIIRILGPKGMRGGLCGNTGSPDKRKFRR